MTPSAELLFSLEHWFDHDAPVSPSISYALFDRSGVLFHHGIGEFQFDGRAPALDTVYRIASMSKSFEVAAVLALRDRGLLRLDDLVSAHVPQFTDPVDASGVPLPVTLHMLMSNCSGLPEDNGWADHELGLSRADFLAVIAAGLRFADLPGVGYQYSNIGFWLLGVVVENVSGQNFAEFATASLLDPLGLSATRYDIAHYPEHGVGAGIAQGFGTFDDGTTWFDRPVVGTGIGGCAASLFSTVSDIARWSGWLSSAFDPDNSDDTVLSRASRRLMQRVHTFHPSSTDHPAERTLEGSGYGLGLAIDHDVRFGAIAQHSGGLPGWSSNMRWHLASGLGVVVFANTNGVRPGIAAAAMLRAALADQDAPARETVLLPSTVAAAVAIDAAIVGAGDVTAIDAQLSPNLLSDVPAEERATRLVKALAEVGGLADARSIPPLADRLAWCVSAAQLTFTIPGREGELECRFEMTPTQPALVQRLDIEKRPAVTALSPTVRHYRPLIA
ncbi:serine hydrolase [Cryobacterium sp. PAMC25264]|uniref:serine hydrolase domain-containing protein n=1 Tax=Cryobacterium sp. PAMC25264 TaxID=2861288 RepID=UPI001C6330D0|nr:serine hydrolase domain-containing protein [Cryobacterium sp. PAMC25264]QYF72800.1 beta-lactamase family protein [Cryobacterium sp. PAMC25264]